VRLTGVPVYEVTEIFNDILVSSPGVTDVKRLRLVIDPRHPRACEAVWSVALEGTNLFRLESRVFNRLRAVAIEEGGEGDPAFTFQPCLADRTLLSRIRPWSASAHEIHFVLCDPDPTDPAAFRGPQWRSGVETVMPGSKGFE
jgi:hypothetical protein